MGEYERDGSGKNMTEDYQSYVTGGTGNLDIKTEHTNASIMKQNNKYLELNEVMSCCLRGKEWFQINLMTKRYIRIRLFVEELSDSDNCEYILVDESEGVVIQKETDLLKCSVVKVRESSSSRARDESGLDIMFDNEDDDDRTLDNDDFIMTTARQNDHVNESSLTTATISNSNSTNSNDTGNQEKNNSNFCESTTEGKVNVCQLCRLSFSKWIEFANHMKIHMEKLFSSETAETVVKTQPNTCTKGKVDNLTLEDAKDQKKNRIEGLVESLRSQKMSTVSDENVPIKPEPNLENDNEGVKKRKRSHYKCSVCEKEFLYQKSFQKHLKTHTPNQSVDKQKQIKSETEKNSDTEYTDGLSSENQSVSLQVEFSGDDDSVEGEEEATDLSKDPSSDDETKDPDFLPGKNNMKVNLRRKLDAKNKDQIQKDGMERETAGSDARKSDLKTEKVMGQVKKKVKGQIKKEVKSQVKKDGLLPKTENGLYPCDLCGKTFTQSGSRKEHMNTHKGERPFKCKLCPKSYAWSGNLRGHFKRVHSSERPYHCTICGQGYTERNQLKKHMRIHSGIRPHKCKICGHEFLENSQLRNHMIIHSGIKSHACKICGRKFSLKGYLREHVKIHSSERNYICDICGKRYVKGEHLKVHKIACHTVGKNFHCQLCGKSFVASFRLKMHMTTHSKPVICEICGKAFSNTSTLSAHMVMHTGEKKYECEICGKRFRWQGGYKKHMWGHGGVKKYPCSICGKRFGMRNNLKDHMNTHSGEKPYKCQLCTSKFGHHNNLRRHYKNLHPNYKYPGTGNKLEPELLKKSIGGEKLEQGEPSLLVKQGDSSLLLKQGDSSLLFYNVPYDINLE